MIALSAAQSKRVKTQPYYVSLSPSLSLRINSAKGLAAQQRDCYGRAAEPQTASGATPSQ